MAGAVRALKEEAVIELTMGRAARLLDPVPLLAEGRYYLVRSSVYAPPGASVDELLDRSRTASYGLWVATTGDAVLLTAQPSTGSGFRAQNIAMIVRSNTAIPNLIIACYAPG